MINENSIRERAIWLWKQAGSPEGRDLEFWLKAERSLAEEPEQGGVNQHQDEGSSDRPDNFAPTPWAKG